MFLDEEQIAGEAQIASVSRDSQKQSVPAETPRWTRFWLIDRSVKLRRLGEARTDKESEHGRSARTRARRIGRDTLSSYGRDRPLEATPSTCSSRADAPSTRSASRAGGSTSATRNEAEQRLQKVPATADRTRRRCLSDAADRSDTTDPPVTLEGTDRPSRSRATRRFGPRSRSPGRTSPLLGVPPETTGALPCRGFARRSSR
jgi:hypothetical protein